MVQGGERAVHLHYLVGINDELLAEQRARVAGAADGSEVLEAALEVLFVRQDGQARSAPGLVAGRDLDGVKVWLDDASAGGGLLYLCDEAWLAVLLELAQDGPPEVSWWRCLHKHQSSVGVDRVD